MSWESDLDRHITGNYGEDSVKEMVCPSCGHTAEDMIETDVSVKDEDGFDWECPECGRLLSNDDLVTIHEFRMQMRDDEPQDFDERRDADDRF